MEHRSSQRVPLRYPVELYSLRLGAVPATTRDICREGMLVDVGDAKLPLYAHVKLTIDVNRVRYHVDALVVHTSPAGIGLMYGDLDADTSVTLYTALRRATHAGPAGARVPFWLQSKDALSSERDADASQ